MAIKRLATVNKKKIYYANPSQVVMATDDYGLMTGEKTVTYEEKKPYKAYITPHKGRADLEVFGTEIKYSGVMIAESDCPIDENSRLWIDTNGSAYNWVVVKKAPALEHIIYAIEEVNVGWQSLSAAVK